VAQRGESSQIDENGGQSLQALGPWGDVVMVTKTDEFWNHALGWSIMSLGGSTRVFRRGDRAYLLLVVKADGETEFQFLGVCPRNGANQSES
jgi:hypothetical protein